jgi:hypothetical protein
MTMFMISVASLGMALIGSEMLLLTRWHERSSVAVSIGYQRPPGWLADPWGQATSRWWDGFNWTGRLK